MRILLFSVAGVVLIGIAVMILGALLPATREGTASATIEAPAALVRSTVLDVESQPAWRARVKAVERQSDTAWTEIAADGERISFRLTDAGGETLALEFESNRGYVGRWEARLETLASGATRIAVREQATVASPVGRLLSRLFFSPGAFAAAYLEDLAREVARRRTASGA
jgi:hypothetical protein